MSYPRRKAELVDYLQQQMALMVQHAITTSERADQMTAEQLGWKVRTVDRAIEQLGWHRERLSRLDGV